MARPGGQVEGARRLRGRGLPSPEHRRDPHPLRAARDRGDRGRPGRDGCGGGLRRRVPVSRHPWPRPRLHRPDRRPARAARPRHRHRRPAGADAAEGAGRDGRRHRRGIDPAIRRADGLWRPARRLHGLQGFDEAVDAGAHRRRLGRCARQPGLPAEPADPGAAYPARKGDFQRLHGAGAPRRHGLVLRRVPRARGAEGDRAAHPPEGRRRGRGAGGGGLHGGAARLLRHDHRGMRRVARGDLPRRRRPADQPAPGGAHPARHRAGRDDPAGDRGAPAGGLRRGGDRAGRLPHPRGSGAPLGLPHPPGVPHEPGRDRDDALHAPAGRPGPGARPGDDPAGLLHHEAQRGGRDGGGHLAANSPISIPSRRPTRPRATAS